MRLLPVAGLLLGATLAHAQDAPDPAPAAPDAQAAPAEVRTHHGADAPPRARRADTWDARGEARIRMIGGSDPVLDDVGTRAGRTSWATTRLIVGADWRPSERVTVDVELEALNGHLAGDTTTVGNMIGSDTFRVSRDGPSDLRFVIPRKLNVAWTIPGAGRLSVGTQMFTWGTGILANDGAGDPPFGDANTGSVVGRVAFATAPYRQRGSASAALRSLAFFVAADVVIRDDNAFLYLGDTAIQGVVGFRVDVPRITAGGLAVVRWQRDRIDERDPRPGFRSTVLAFPMDAHVRVLLTPEASDHRVNLEGEVVHIRGRTDRSYLESTIDGARVNSLGALLRLRYDHDPSRLTAQVEAGYASGDADGRDDVVRTATLHTDHNAGMLLFEHLLPMITTRGLDRALDPTLSAQGPPGARYLVNQGAVSNAWYLFPTLRARVLPDLDLRFGWLAAWTDAPLADAYQTALAGGFDTGPGGVSGGRFYGHEVDVGVRYTFRLPGAVGLELGAEGAAFSPGSAFDGLEGDRLGLQGLGRARLTLTW